MNLKPVNKQIKSKYHLHIRRLYLLNSANYLIVK